jgi:DNA/RNA endonuclease YhcR with UshA esterase domain
MKTRSLAVLLLSGCARLALADSTNLPVKISAAEAAQHYDQVMTVTGMVAQVTLRPSIVFINFDLPFPKSPLAAVIHSKDTNQFGDLPSLKGRSVEITGKVQKYHDKPEIVVEKAGQIFVPDGWITPTNAPVAPKGANDLPK